MDELRDCNDVPRGSKYNHDRTIIHIDIDCFYAQVEILKNPVLASKPVGIKQQHYIITCNYVAREYGLKKCMVISEALALCPKLVIINGEDLHDYRSMSSKVTTIIKQFTDKVEKLGLDENFADVTDLVSLRLQQNHSEDLCINGHIYLGEIEQNCTCGCRRRIILGSKIASEIREKVREELGLTCCAGISHNKLLAKLVGSTHKPNQQTSVFPCSAVTLVSNLNHVRGIPGVGRKASDILDAIGISTISDAQNTPLTLLEKHFDKTFATWIKGACFGIDDMDVKESGRQQVIGLEEAAKKINSFEEVSNRLISLTNRGLLLLQEDGRFPTTIRVSVRKYSSQEYTRQRNSKQCSINPSLFRASNAKELIVDTALGLFKSLVDIKRPFHLTLIGLAFTHFQAEVPCQSSLLQFLSVKNKNSNTSKKSNLTGDRKRMMLDSENLSSVKSKNQSVYSDIGDIDESVLNELPEEIRLEVLSSNSYYNTKQCNSLAQNSSQRNCPPGIDLEVFYQLPNDIQKQIIQDANLSTPKNVKSFSKPNSILRYMKK